ncbi:MAG: thiamine pyrophosphate-dependent enzyme [Minisyncoccales bacterium]|jgi:2-oxoglutarate ferredoxin oxidoreductase subunit beta
MENLNLPTKNTWCPGCGNFPLLKSLKKAIVEIEKEGKKRENFVLVGGIGCHGKITDYININSFSGLHGRAVSLAEGIKIANPNLDVICCSGDGDSYNEGMAHLIHTAKRNTNITVIIHDNHNFALTVKQYTSTSPKGFKGSSTPEGSIETPINPLELMIASGATFVARGYSSKTEHLADLIKKGIKHKGFSFIEVLQPCVTWYNTLEKYNKSVYEIETEKGISKNRALTLASKWDYNSEKRIPIGIFYQEIKKSFEEEAFSRDGVKEKVEMRKLLKDYA